MRRLLPGFLILSALSAWGLPRRYSLPAVPAASGNQVLSALEARYRGATTLQANFLERYSENGTQVRVEAGKAYFLRPGKMRWEYEKPEKSMFLVDGKFVWFYAPDDHTATRMRAKKSDDWRTPIAFLTTGMKLSRICSEVGPAQDVKPSNAGNEVYRCVLRTAENERASAGQKVLFEISPQSELARIVIPQEAGMQIEFDFKDWEWNPALAKTLFQFEPPPGTVIVNGLLPEAPGMRQ
ncbi:MAG TPA: outer membrane lipoprotein carrier protein LolA [Candidatus Acidoferrales bacterium]|jgi:outer membrane lipoprotein carrier protein|nr:outer membrane lipoprotein carrier protein LolA [Candidatus Acidoferrales bacterium]